MPSWTKEEEKLGRVLLKEATNHSGSFVIRVSCASKALGYPGYRNVPPGVRMFISSIGGTVNKVKRNHRLVKKNKAFVANLMLLWQEDILSYPSLQHGLHPEDEKELSEFFLNKQAVA